MRRLAALQRKWNALPGKMENMAAEAVTASARRAAEIARELVPVDSGELRSGISAAPEDRLSAVVSSAAGHAAMVEYGTSKMAAQPYMQPAAEAERTAFFREAAVEFRRLAKEK